MKHAIGDFQSVGTNANIGAATVKSRPIFSICPRVLRQVQKQQDDAFIENSKTQATTTHQINFRNVSSAPATGLKSFQNTGKSSSKDAKVALARRRHQITCTSFLARLFLHIIN
jgi:hypothetical protein